MQSGVMGRPNIWLIVYDELYPLPRTISTVKTFQGNNETQGRWGVTRFPARLFSLTALDFCPQGAKIPRYRSTVPG